MSKVEQVLGSEPRAGRIVSAAEVGMRRRQVPVHGHERHAAVPDLLQVDVGNRLVRRPEDDTVHPLVEESMQILQFAAIPGPEFDRSRLVGVVQDRQIIVRGKRPVDTTEHAAMERVPRIHHHTHGPAAAGVDSPHQPIGPILKPPRDLLHTRTRFGRHDALSAKRARHRHFRDPEFCGDLADRDPFLLWAVGSGHALR